MRSDIGSLIPFHEKAVEQAQGCASSAIRDALREALRTAQRRVLSEKEGVLFATMVDELEVRGKKGHRG